MRVGHFSNLHGDYSARYGISERPELWIWSDDMLPLVMILK